MPDNKPLPFGVYGPWPAGTTDDSKGLFDPNWNRPIIGAKPRKTAGGSRTLTIESDDFEEGFKLFLEDLLFDSSQAGKVALVHEAEYLLKLSQAQVPVDTGQLLASGRVETEFEDEDIISVDIAYGGPAGSGPGQTEDVDYAVVVHEDLMAIHPRGKAKFLEDPVREEVSSGRTGNRMFAELQRTLVKTIVAFQGKGGAALRGARGRFVGSVKGGVQ